MRIIYLLGVTSLIIDPHFDINSKKQVNEIINNSKNKMIIGISNDSGIRIGLDNIEYLNLYINMLMEI